MIYKGKPIRIIHDSGIRMNETYFFDEIIEDLHGYTVLKRKGREIHIEKENYNKVKDLQFFKTQKGMQGSWRYIIKATKEEVEEVKSKISKVKEEKKEKTKEVKTKDVKKDAEEFDNLLKTI